MSEYAIYIRTNRTSHSKYKGTVEASSAAVAFKRANAKLSREGITTDMLCCFYVAPVNPKPKTPYSKQKHGWQYGKSYPS
jgi:hypothetical protein